MADQRVTDIVRICDSTTLTQGLAVDASGRITVASVAGNVTVVGTGTLAVQVDGSALTALQKIDDPVFVDDAAFTPGTSSVMMVGAQLDNTGTDSVDEGDAGALRMSANRCLYVNVRDAAGNERGLNVDASGNIGVTDAGGTLTVDGSVTVSATNLDVRDLVQGSDNVSVWSNTVKDGSGTDYQPLVDTDGHLQVDVLSGGGVATPTNASVDITNVTTPVNLAAGASGNADSGSLDSKYLWQVVVSGSVAFKAVLATIDNGSATNKAVFFGGPDAPVVYTPRAGFIQAPAAGAGTQGFRTAITNLDTSETADFYVSYFAADNAG